jgi:hypothetical protein
LLVGGNLTGFTPGSQIHVSYVWPTGTTPQWLLDNYVQYHYVIPTADAAGNATYSFADNCNDSNNVPVSGPQSVDVTATDGTYAATGTGILACP